MSYSVTETTHYYLRYEGVKLLLFMSTFPLLLVPVR